MHTSSEYYLKVFLKPIQLVKYILLTALIIVNDSKVREH